MNTSSRSPSSQAEVGFQPELVPMRPFKTFPSSAALVRSTAFGLHPDTWIRAGIGLGFEQLIEEWDYKAYLALQALKRKEETGSTLQQGTRDTLNQLMAGYWPGNRAISAIRAESTESHSVGSEPVGYGALNEGPNALHNPWRMLMRSFGRGLEPTPRRLLVRLAAYDRFAHQFDRAPSSRTKDTLIRRYFEGAAGFWDATGLRIEPWACIAIDSAIQHLSWLDQQPQPRLPGLQGSLSSLACHSKVPMRHWFDDLLRQLKLGDLQDLHLMLVRRRALRYDTRAIAHSTLKKWASGAHLMPRGAVPVLLKACEPHVHHDAEAWRYVYARVLTYLTEALCAFARSPIEAVDARKALQARLGQLSGQSTSAAATEPDGVTL